MEDCTARRDRVLLEEVLRDKEGVRKKKSSKGDEGGEKRGRGKQKKKQSAVGSGLENINGLTSLLSLFTHPRSDPSICTRGGLNANRSFLGHSAGS